MVAFGGNFVGAPHHPGIFRGTVDAQLFEQFFEAGVELARGTVAIELERKIARGRHDSGRPHRSSVAQDRRLVTSDWRLVEECRGEERLINRNTPSPLFFISVDSREG